MAGEITIEKTFYFAPFRKRSRAKVTILKRRSDVLSFAGREGVREIRAEIDSESWGRPPVRLKKSFRYKVGKNTVTFVSDHPGASALENGVKRYQMKHLKGSTVPIIRPDGTLIFRTCTAKSLADGKWVHPGYLGRHFMRRASQRARRRVIQVLTDHTIGQVAEIMGFRR